MKTEDKRSCKCSCRRRQQEQNTPKPVSLKNLILQKTNQKLLIIWYWIQISFGEIRSNSTRLHYLCPSVHTCTDPRHEL